MPRLAEAQAALRDAIVVGDSAAILPLLTAGKGRDGERDPTHRLSIHQRHYDATLGDVICKRFPALQWLVGEHYLRAAALTYSRGHPPRGPALNGYGEDFPTFLVAQPGAEGMPWLAEVGALEWQLGEVAAAVDHPAAGLDALARFEAVPLEALHLRLEPGLAYRAFQWPVDDLVRLHLEGDAPAEFRFDPARVLLEVHGARGAFSMRRLDEPEFAFRAALHGGAPLAAAIAAAEASGAFDPGSALAALFGDRLVTEVVAAEAAP
jgi:hypothetical protein